VVNNSVCYLISEWASYSIGYLINEGLTPTCPQAPLPEPRHPTSVASALFVLHCTSRQVWRFHFRKTQELLLSFFSLPAKNNGPHCDHFRTQFRNSNIVRLFPASSICIYFPCNGSAELLVSVTLNWSIINTKKQKVGARSISGINESLYFVHPLV
jgi:hypothetical protein